jgi:hypothetical protein
VRGGRPRHGQDHVAYSQAHDVIGLAVVPPGRLGLRSWFTIAGLFAWSTIWVYLVGVARRGHSGRPPFLALNPADN